MKDCVLLSAVYILAFNICFGEIRNGYGTQISNARASLRTLNALLIEENSLSAYQKIQIKARIEKAEEFVTYYKLTESLLRQFRSIAPDLYIEIDTIRDRQGRTVDVYVRFVPEPEVQKGAAATTNIAQSGSDKDAYSSEYGVHSVSVAVAVGKKSLLLLAHELGHVRHQVPNLAGYFDYYSTNYANATINSNFIGHDPKDSSGKTANAYEKRFNEQFLNFLKLHPSYPENPLALLQQIKRQVQ